jgi:mannose-6-phosphate isomerase-like protein (cupin superfamily)
MNSNRLTPEAALEALANEPSGAPFLTLFRHGSLEIEIYKPIDIDRQTPHTRDEIYVVIAGSGEFVCGDHRRPFIASDVLFAPAGVVHRFENFSMDFSTWVFFYGPEGGEAGRQRHEPEHEDKNQDDQGQDAR